ncbi:extracellular calcium-sensing receptor-like [Ambystoma mexicanum]|uniref:extracellular calcium-sensing receptor-like n=1 Tax=Ambystoma mexicanum TaxID=8296 RepID=UPI0037E8E8B2
MDWIETQQQCAGYKIWGMGWIETQQQCAGYKIWAMDWIETQRQCAGYRIWGMDWIETQQQCAGYGEWTGLKCNRIVLATRSGEWTGLKRNSSVLAIRTGEWTGLKRNSSVLAIRSGFHVRFYRDLLAMVFAIEEINRTPELLPNMTLGFQIYDSCGSQARAIQGLLQLLSGDLEPTPGYSCNSNSMPLGVVGEILSSVSVPLARISGLFRFPQISYGSVLSTLSDKLQFPSFLRTVPSSTFQNIALARLMGHFGWTWIGMITSDDDVGIQGGQAMKRVIEQNEGCVAFMEKVHLSYAKARVLHIVEVSQRHSVKVIIIHSSEVHVKMLMEAFSEQNVSDTVFVFSASFTLTLGLFPESSWKLFNGSLALVLHFTKMPGFHEFLANLNPLKDPNDTFVRIFWEKALDCRWPGSNRSEEMAPMGQRERPSPCSENQTLDIKLAQLFELDDLGSTYHTYLAVYALAHALNSLMSCKPGRGPFLRGACGDVNNIQPWQVLHYVKKVNISFESGATIYFDANGDAPSAYDILNMQIFREDDIRLVNVGSYDVRQGEEVHINTDTILWPGDSVGSPVPVAAPVEAAPDHVGLRYKVPRSVCSDDCLPGYRKLPLEGRPVCCFQCIPCPYGEITGTQDSSECVKCSDDQWTNEKHDQCIPKKIEFLSFGEPLGITLAICASILTFTTAAVLGVFLKYRDTPIVRANNRGLSYLLLVSLIFCFLCSFLFIGHPQEITCMLRQTVFGIIFSISVSSVLAKTIVVVIAFKSTNPNSPARKWLGPRTPSCIVFACSMTQVFICVLWLVRHPPFPELGISPYKEVMIFACNEGAAIFFYCMLGYMGLLTTVSFIVAFLSRNLPGSFNEAKLITFSMLVFVSVWISFIPAYLSTRGKYMVAVEVFAILCSSAGLLGCIFFPKCYMILLRPDKNTKHHLVGKARFSSTKIE